MAGLEINTSTVILGNLDSSGVPQYTSQYQPGYFSISSNSVVVTSLALTNSSQLVINHPNLISVGQLVEAYGIPQNTKVTGISGNTITLSTAITSNISSGTTLILGSIAQPESCALPPLSSPTLDLGGPITPMDRSCNFAFPNVNLVTPVYNAPNAVTIACERINVNNTIVQKGAAKGNIIINQSSQAPDCGIDFGGTIDVLACESVKMASSVTLTGAAVGSLSFTQGNTAPDCGARLTGNIYVPEACKAVTVTPGIVKFPPNMSGSVFSIYSDPNNPQLNNPKASGTTGAPPCAVKYDLNLQLRACEKIKINPMFAPPMAFLGSSLTIKPKLLNTATATTAGGATGDLNSVQNFASQQEQDCSVDLELDLRSNFCESYEVVGQVTTAGMAHGKIKLTSVPAKPNCKLALEGTITVPEPIFSNQVQTHGLPWLLNIEKTSASNESGQGPQYQLKGNFIGGERLSNIIYNTCFIPITLCVLGVSRTVKILVKAPPNSCCGGGPEVECCFTDCAGRPGLFAPGAPT